MSYDPKMNRRSFLSDYVVKPAIGVSASAVANPLEAIAREQVAARPPAIEEGYWTSDRFEREIATSGVRAIVHWRLDGTGDNRRGDQFMYQLARRYGPQVDRIVRINLKQHYESNPYDEKRLREVPGRYNPDRGGVVRAPAYSVFDGDRETRINGLPADRHELTRVIFPAVDSLLR